MNDGPGRFYLVALLVGLHGLAQVKAEETAAISSPPPFKKLRQDEDYAYLSDPSRRSDFLDAIKFIPFNTNQEDWYVTLGGEIRERYEYYHNNLWGIPIFIVSALNESWTQTRRSTARFARFFTKPVDLKVLRESVRAAAGERQALIRSRSAETEKTRTAEAAT